MWKLEAMLLGTMESSGADFAVDEEMKEPKMELKGHPAAQPQGTSAPAPPSPPQGFPFSDELAMKLMGYIPPEFPLAPAENRKPKHYPLDVSKKKMVALLEAVEEKTGDFPPEQSELSESASSSSSPARPSNASVLFGIEIGRQLMNSSQDATIEEVAEEVVTRYGHMSKTEKAPWKKRFEQLLEGEYKGYRVPEKKYKYKKNKLPAPPTAFKIFANEYRHQYEGSGLPKVLIDRELEIRFACMSIAEKHKFYEEQARQIKDHYLHYPYYPLTDEDIVRYTFYVEGRKVGFMKYVEYMQERTAMKQEMEEDEEGEEEEEEMDDEECSSEESE